MKGIGTRSWLVLFITGTGFAGLTWPAAAGGDGLQAVPFEFVGKAGDCGAGYPAGSRIVTAAWLTGMGLPDNGGLNSSTGDPADNPDKNDPRKGLLLSKNGPTLDCSSAGAVITGVKRITATPLKLGFDYRNGGHCGANAPRFNVLVKGSSDTLYVFGCAGATTSLGAPQDPTEWTRVRFQTSLPAGSKIKSIAIVYDEGTDTPSWQDPNGVGLAVLDNICVDGKLVAPGRAKGKDRRDKDEDRGGKEDDKDRGGKDKRHASSDTRHGNDDNYHDDDDDDDNNGAGNDQICATDGVTPDNVTPAD